MHALARTVPPVLLCLGSIANEQLVRAVSRVAGQSFTRKDMRSPLLHLTVAYGQVTRCTPLRPQAYRIAVDSSSTILYTFRGGGGEQSRGNHIRLVPHLVSSLRAFPGFWLVVKHLGSVCGLTHDALGRNVSYAFHGRGTITVR